MEHKRWKICLYYTGEDKLQLMRCEEESPSVFLVYLVAGHLFSYAGR